MLRKAITAVTGIAMASFTLGFIFGLIALPRTTEAAIIAVQNTDHSVRATSGPGHQSLGNGLSGSGTMLFSFYATTTTGSPEGMNGTDLVACATSSYTQCYVFAEQTTLVDLTAQKNLNTITFSNATTSINSSFYYYISFGSAANARVYGSSSDTYTNGKYCANFIGSGADCTVTDATLTSDAYFIFATEPNITTEGITAIITPTYGQVVADENNVNFSFTYNSYTYTRAGFNLVDHTTGQNIITTSSSSSISSSGSGTFNGYLDLVSGHTYTWTPWMSDSITGSPTIYGTPTFFFSVTNSSVYVPPASPNPFATSTWSYGYNISTTTAGTTTILSTSTRGTSGILPTNLDLQLRRKFPFSYVYDIWNLLQELANGNRVGYQDAEYTLPMGKTANGSSTITIINASQIADIDAVEESKKLISNGLYIITGLGVIGMIMSAL